MIPDPKDPTWVDEVDADIFNESVDLMARAKVSVVLFNQAGAVVGGGRGTSTGSLPGHATPVRGGHDGCRRLQSSDAVQAIFTVVPEYESE